MLLPLLIAGTLLSPPASASPLPTTATVLRGHLDHAPAGDTVRLLYGRAWAKTVLSPTGDFELVLPDWRAAAPVTFMYARQQASLYLTPGDNLQLHLDFPRFDETLRFTGRGAAVNNYLAQARWKFAFGPAGPVPRPPDQLRPTTTPTQLRRLADAFRAEQRRFLAAYAATQPLPPAFAKEEKLLIDLQWATYLLEYPGEQRPGNATPEPLPATYFDFLKELPLSALNAYAGGDRGLEENTVVARFLKGYTHSRLPDQVLRADPAVAPRLYSRVTADLGATYARDLGLFLLLSWELDNNLAGVVAAYPTFKAQNRDSTFARSLRGQLSQQLGFQPGALAPAFTLRDNTGKAVSMSDFRGKVVYLDFWGTWCGPCMQEMPASKALRQQFLGRDVVFVYVAVQDKEEKWQQVVAAQQLTGPNSVHLRNAESSTASDYGIHKYPSYLLIGRDGRFITAAAPRPSDAAAAALAIEQALGK